MARVMLVNPPIYDFAAYDLWARPLGLLYVAAFLERQGHEVRIVDCLDRLHPATAQITGKHAPRSRRYGTGSYYWQEVETPACYGGIPRIYKRFGLPREIISDEMRHGDAPDVVGVTSGMTYWYMGVEEAVRIARETFPGVPVALGGVYATLCPEHARERIAPDYLVTGPGECAMARIVNEVAGGGAPEGDFPFAEMPNPAYHLLGRLESASILTGRGCPYRCAYCASQLLSRGIERRNISAVADEVEGYAARFGVRDVAFYDDALLWEPERHIKPLLREIIRRGPKIRLHTPNGLHTRMLDAELAKLMKDARFVTIRLSLETVNAEREADWDNKVRYDDFLSAVRHLEEAGFPRGDLGAYVMTGLPGETFEEAARSIAAVHAAGVAVRLAQYSPIPGTDYFATARAASTVDIDEPLLQNNTAIPAGAAGPYADYEKLKSLVRILNDRLAAGRRLLTPAQMAGDFSGIVSVAGISL